MRKTIEERFWNKVEVKGPDECWPWTGGINLGGYGKFHWTGVGQIGAHRAAYQLSKGQIPDGLEIDHLCSSRDCVNHAHLEAVTPQENCLRGTSPAAICAKHTHCPQGHPFSEENTMRTKTGRKCRICR